MTSSQPHDSVIFNGKIFSTYENNKLLLIKKHIEHISELEGLEDLTHLTYLNLSRNKITRIAGLDNLTHLEELNLRLNQIVKIEGFSELSNLKKLVLDRNRIKKIEGLDGLQNLEFLDLSANRIKTIEGIDKLGNIKKVNLEYNPILHIDNNVSIPKKCQIILGFVPLCATPTQISEYSAKNVYISNSLIHLYAMETLKLSYEYSDNMSLTLYELMKVFPDLALPKSFDDGIKVIQRLDALQLTQTQFQNVIKDGKMTFWKAAYIYAKSFFWMRYGDKYIRVPDQLSFSEAENILRKEPDLRVPSKDWRFLEQEYQKRKRTEFFKYQKKVLDSLSHSQMLL